ncbi:hypothetical protein OK18_19120 [Chryseobacterium gallinarum]|uniref:Uncharacterized protein n=1 Tax=Chryseobacterium gallinarum TaxID=1324352 RepID=A0A0G3M6B2_CHRGL|nr:hypothetical protein [Chryseobacterium gallinarum]AKK74444.1 hypothetical protein OK18_19120 [Chryseobacterium gallinarum]
MKRTFFFIFCVLLFIIPLGTVVSCKVVKPPAPMVIENTREVTKTIRDTVYKIEADSSYYEAYIDCINGKPILREIQETQSKSQPGKIINIPKASIKGNKLSVECTKQAQKLFKQWKETYIKDTKQTPVYIDKPVYRDKPLTWFQNVQIWLGRIFLGLITAILLAVILRWKRII